MKFPPDSFFSHRLFVSGRHRMETGPGSSDDYNWKVLILQQKLSRKQLQLEQGDHSETIVFPAAPSNWSEKWFFQSWQLFIPFVFVFWAKKGFKYNRVNHIIWLACDIIWLACDLSHFLSHFLFQITNLMTHFFTTWQTTSKFLNKL